MGGWRKRGKGTNMFKELNIADIFVLRYNKTAEGKYQQTYTPEEFDQMQEWLDRALGEHTQSMEVENNMLRARNERLEKTLAQQEQGEPVAEVKRNSSGQIYIEWRDGEFAIANLVDAKLYTTPQPAQKQEQYEPVQVTIRDFVNAVEGEEDLVGRPVYWAQWPNEEKNT